MKTRSGNWYISSQDNDWNKYQLEIYGKRSTDNENSIAVFKIIELMRAYEQEYLN